MSKDKTIVVNVASLRGAQDKDNIYRDWLYLDTNVSTPALKALHERVEKSTEPFTSDEKKQHIDGLFATLEEWASRDKEYGVDKAYNDYQNAIKIDPNNTNKARREFVEHCAHNSEIKWDSNQIEKVCATVLLDILDDKQPVEAKGTLQTAMTNYTETCQEQVDKDFHRNLLHIDSQNEQRRISERDDFIKEKYPNLTGEQIGFIHTMVDQGKFVGGTSTAVLSALGMNGMVVATYVALDNPPRTLIRQEGDKTYFVSTTVFGEPQYDPQVKTKPVVTCQTIVDITELKGEHFTPGMASGAVRTQVALTGSEETIAKLTVPPDCARATNIQEQQLLDVTASYLPRALDAYLKEHVKPGEVLTEDAEHQLSEGMRVTIAPFFQGASEQLNAVVQNASSIAKDYKQGMSFPEIMMLIKSNTHNDKNETLNAAIQCNESPELITRLCAQGAHVDAETFIEHRDKYPDLKHPFHDKVSKASAGGYAECAEGLEFELHKIYHKDATPEDKQEGFEHFAKRVRNIDTSQNAQFISQFKEELLCITNGQVTKEDFVRIDAAVKEIKNNRTWGEAIKDVLANIISAVDTREMRESKKIAGSIREHLEKRQPNAAGEARGAVSATVQRGNGPTVL